MLQSSVDNKKKVPQLLAQVRRLSELFAILRILLVFFQRSGQFVIKAHVAESQSSEAVQHLQDSRARLQLGRISMRGRLVPSRHDGVQSLCQHPQEAGQAGDRLHRRQAGVSHQASSLSQ